MPLLGRSSQRVAEPITSRRPAHNFEARRISFEMAKLTIPSESNLYPRQSKHARVMRVVALSGGYIRDDACAKLSHNKDMIASFSRALVEDLTFQMSDAEFGKSLAQRWSRRSS
jgi:fructose-bisphosphate aldolase class 1